MSRRHALVFTSIGTVKYTVSELHVTYGMNWVRSGQLNAVGVKKEIWSEFDTAKLYDKCGPTTWFCKISIIQIFT